MDIVVAQQLLPRLRDLDQDDLLAGLRGAAVVAPQGKRHRLRCGPGTTLDVVREPNRLALLAAAAPAQPLAALSRRELLALGVPATLVERAQRATSPAALAALPLPAEVRQSLRVKLLQLDKSLPEPTPLDVRRAVGLDHLADYLRGDIRQLLLDLRPEQRRIVEIEGAGNILVRGVAGSGKTAVLLHRVHHVLRQQDLFGRRRCLVVTFNRALRAAIVEMLSDMGCLRGGHVEVKTCASLLRELSGWRGRILQGRERQRLLRSAIASVRATVGTARVWSFPDAFWDEELALIAGRVVGGRAEYLTLPRTGMGRVLDAELRDVVWQVHRRYHEQCAAAAAMDFAAISRLGYRELGRAPGKAPRFDFVFVDEAQDLTPVELRALAMLTGAEGQMLVACDPAQSIYQRAFRWKNAGITVHGARSFNLTRNYRNPARILDAARPLLGALRERGEDPDEDPPEPRVGTRLGTAPRTLVTSAGGEDEAIAADVLVQLERGVPPQNMAVLCRRNGTCRAVEAALRARHVEVQMFSSDRNVRLQAPAVKVLTIHSAKGLEFPLVYLVASATQWSPVGAAPLDREARERQDRRLFYVAMTRSLAELVIVHAAGDRSPLLPAAGTNR